MMGLIKINDLNEYGDFFYNYYHKMHDKTVVSFDRLMVIYQVLKSIIKKKNKEYSRMSCAEIGVFRGGTSSLILNALNNMASLPFMELFVFDTFEGLPEVNKKEDLHKTGEFSNTSFKEVKDFLESQKGEVFLKVEKGEFPHGIKDDTKAMLNLKNNLGGFDFVHLDVDLYQSYKDCLEFFYYKMNNEGVIICDDYNFDTCPGAKKAVDEFFKNKKENVFCLTTNQALIIKG